MKETSFPARVTQEMLSEFLANELELSFVGPKLISQSIEFYSIERSETFCNRFKIVEPDISNLIRDVTKLQLFTCAAFALIELPTNESLNRSTAILRLIQRFYPGSEEERSARIQKFLAYLEANVGERKSDLETCLAFAEVDLNRMP
jgi:hypothetical protein